MKNCLFPCHIWVRENLIKTLVIMKLTALLLLASCLNVAANGYAQNVSLNEKDVSITKIFKSIKKQTGYVFFFDENWIKEAGSVSVQVHKVPFTVALDLCFKEKPITYSIIGKTIVIKLKELASPIDSVEANKDVPQPPPVPISGTIVDENKNGLAGVSVTVKGTDIGTTTNEMGQFSLQLPEKGGILVISYVGYQTIETPLKTSGTYNFTMKLKQSSIEEVYVVGYGTQSKKAVSTAVSQVSNEEIIQSQSFSVSNSLAGRVPGLIVNQRSSRPGSDEASVFIRGISTIGNTAALIVVDGVANRDGISRLDPNEIETVTVLKDASAAIYGAQSANGVILITTKRGTKGKPLVRYSFNHGLASPTRFIKLSDAATYVKGLNDLDLQNGRTPTYSPEQVADYESGKLPSTDWLRAVYKNHFSQNRQSLNVSGGNEAVRYFLSVGLGTQGTILKNDDKSKYQQYNFRSNIDATISPNFTVGFDLAGRREHRNFPGIGESDIFGQAVLGSPLLPATIFGNYPAPGRGNNNPLAMVQSASYNRTENNVIAATLKAAYKIPGVPGLSLDGFAAFDYFQSFNKVWQQPWTYYVEENGAPVPRVRPNGPSLSSSNIRNQSITLNGKLNYNRTIGKHNIDAFVSYEQNQTRSDYLGASRVGFVSPAIDQLFAGSPIKDNQSNDGSATEGARQNYLGRISYAYENKYLAQVYLGINGSQIFPPDKRFGRFPGGSVGWVISREKFMEDIRSVSFLKLRASYGILGNDRVAQFQYLNLFGFGSGYVFGGQDVTSLNPRVAANPNITWEKKRTTDIGLDLGLFNNKVSVTVDYFKSRTSDILARRNASIPNYTGLRVPNENIGIVDNAGVDGQLSYSNRIQDFKWTIGANFTYAKNKIVFYDEVPPAEDYQSLTGRPIGTQLLYKVKGVYRNQEDLTKFPGLDGKRVGDLIYEDVNKDGRINSDDRFPLEQNATPQLQYGFNLGAEWKGFDFNAQFMGQARAVQFFTYIFGPDNNAPEYYIKNAWTPDNLTADLPRIGRSTSGNDLFVRDVSFLRLKTIELGYSIPKIFLTKYG
ncbi:MAG: TonB-dependent receptor, partial [Flavihumibacter sp.]|nr:TonB-dependent receptor [Flavihumibacter sp.]